MPHKDPIKQREAARISAKKRYYERHDELVAYRYGKNREYRAKRKAQAEAVRIARILNARSLAEKAARMVREQREYGITRKEAA